MFKFPNCPEKKDKYLLTIFDLSGVCEDYTYETAEEVVDAIKSWRREWPKLCYNVYYNRENSIKPLIKIHKPGPGGSWIRPDIKNSKSGEIFMKLILENYDPRSVSREYRVKMLLKEADVEGFVEIRSGVFLQSREYLTANQEEYTAACDEDEPGCEWFKDADFTTSPFWVINNDRSKALGIAGEADLLNFIGEEQGE